MSLMKPAAKAATLLTMAKPAATKALSGLFETGIPVEITGRRRDHACSYEAYLNLLRSGTEELLLRRFFKKVLFAKNSINMKLFGRTAQMSNSPGTACDAI
jgi:hypothetical protein